jgi:hypothetical protein
LKELVALLSCLKVLVIQSSRTLLSVFLRMGSNLLVSVSSEHSLISNVLMIVCYYYIVTFFSVPPPRLLLFLIFQLYLLGAADDWCQVRCQHSWDGSWHDDASFFPRHNDVFAPQLLF